MSILNSISYKGHFTNLPSSNISLIFSNLEFIDLISLSLVSKDMNKEVVHSFIPRANDQIFSLKRKINSDFFTEKEKERMKNVLQKSNKSLLNIGSYVKVYTTSKINKNEDVVETKTDEYIENFPKKIIKSKNQSLIQEEKEKNKEYQLKKSKLIVIGLEQYKKDDPRMNFERLICSIFQKKKKMLPFDIPVHPQIDSSKTNLLYPEAALLTSRIIGARSLNIIDEENNKFYRAKQEPNDKIITAKNELTGLKIEKNRLENLRVKRLSKKRLKISEECVQKIYEGCKESILKMDEKSFSYFLTKINELGIDLTNTQKKNIIYHITSLRRTTFLDRYLEHVEETPQVVYLFLRASVDQNNLEYFTKFFPKRNKLKDPGEFTEMFLDASTRESNTKFVNYILQQITKNHRSSLGEDRYNDIVDLVFDSDEKDIKRFLKGKFFKIPRAKIEEIVSKYLHTHKKKLSLLKKYKMIDRLSDSFLQQKFKEAPDEVKEFLIPKKRKVPGLILPQKSENFGIKRLDETISNRFLD